MSSGIRFSLCAETRRWWWWWWWNREIPQPGELFVPESLTWHTPLCSMEIFAWVKVQTAESPAVVVVWFGVSSGNVDTRSCLPNKGFTATRKMRCCSSRHSDFNPCCVGRALTWLHLSSGVNDQLAKPSSKVTCCIATLTWAGLITCQSGHSSWCLSRNVSVGVGVWQPLHRVLRHWEGMSHWPKGFVLLLCLTVQKHTVLPLTPARG